MSLFIGGFLWSCSKAELLPATILPGLIAELVCLPPAPNQLKTLPETPNLLKTLPRPQGKGGFSLGAARQVKDPSAILQASLSRRTSRRAASTPTPLSVTSSPPSRPSVTGWPCSSYSCRTAALTRLRGSPGRGSGRTQGLSISSSPPKGSKRGFQGWRGPYRGALVAK